MQIRHEETYSEIKAEKFGASITVYRPRVHYGDKIQPAHFATSTYHSDSTEVLLEEWLEMLDAALHLQNQFNEIIPGYKQTRPRSSIQRSLDSMRDQWNDIGQVKRRLAELKESGKKFDAGIKALEDSGVSGGPLPRSKAVGNESV